MSFDSVELSEVLIDKGYIRGPFGSALKRGEMKDSGIPVYEQNHAIYDEREFRYFIDKEKYEELKRFQVKKNDLIISCSGTVGEISIINENDPVGIISQALLILRVNAEVILPQYLRFYFTSRTGKHLLLGASHGSVQNNIAKKSIVSSIPIPLPSLEVQRDIVKQLYTLDQKIQLNQQTNKTLEAMAQAIFKSWFVDFDPVQAKIRAKAEGRDANRAAMAAIAGVDLEQDWDEIEAALDQKLSRMSKTQRQQLHQTAELFPEELVDSELGEVPKGWGVTSAEKVLKRVKVPKRIKKDEVEETGKIVVLEQGEGIIMGYHNGEAGFDASPDNPYFIFGDHTCITHLTIEPFDVAPNVIPLQGEEFNSYWTYYAVKDLQQFQEYRRHWSELKVKVLITPNNDIDQVFADAIKPLIMQINKNRNQNLTLSQLRDTLLPKLISGEVGL